MKEQRYIQESTLIYKRLHCELVGKGFSQEKATEMVQNQIEREDRLEKKRLERDEKAAQRQAQKAAEMCKIN